MRVVRQQRPKTEAEQMGKRSSCGLALVVGVLAGPASSLGQWVTHIYGSHSLVATAQTDQVPESSGVIVSLVSCNTGKNTGLFGRANSYAHRLHAELAGRGIDCQVVGRKGPALVSGTIVRGTVRGKGGSVYTIRKMLFIPTISRAKSTKVYVGDR